MKVNHFPPGIPSTAHVREAVHALKILERRHTLFLEGSLISELPWRQSVVQGIPRNTRIAQITCVEGMTDTKRSEMADAKKKLETRT
jgi:hypothetical protein